MESRLAKIGTEPTIESKDITPPQPVMTHSSYWEGVPIEVYQFFGYDLKDIDGKLASEMKQVYDYAKSQIPSQTPELSDYYRIFRSLEVRFGAPKLGESKHRKMLTYIQMSKQINELIKQREML